MTNAECARLAELIRQHWRGEDGGANAWHGPSLRTLVEGVGWETAARRPIEGRHSIWELVLHITAWADIARARLQGERLTDPSASEDWPPIDAVNATAWTSAIERLRDSHRALADDVKQLDEARLAEKVAGLDYTVSNLLHGVIEHSTYHGGQIAILKKPAIGR